jgi:hypothetical protein
MGELKAGEAYLVGAILDDGSIEVQVPRGTWQRYSSDMFYPLRPAL